MRYGISLVELSKLLNLNKSKLAYYVSEGLLRPDGKVSGMYLFDKAIAVRTIVKIQRCQDRGLSLKEIKRELIKK